MKVVWSLQIINMHVVVLTESQRTEYRLFKYSLFLDGHSVYQKNINIYTLES